MLHFVHSVILCSFHGLKEWLYLQENLFDSLLKKDMPKYKILYHHNYNAKISRSLCWFSWCRKRDLNPHDCNSHTDLNRARLPIPPFLHIKLLCCPAADKAYNTTTPFKCQHLFRIFWNICFLYFFHKTVDIMPAFWYHSFLSETN